MRSSSHSGLAAGSPSQHSGRQAEEQALQWQLAAGHQLVMRNFHGRCGEIDLITLEQDMLVFTEVRWRRSRLAGGALASVARRKQQRLIQTARLFLMHYPAQQRRIIRFDVIGFDGVWPSWQKYWIKAAFDAC